MDFLGTLKFVFPTIQNRQYLLNLAILLAKFIYPFRANVLKKGSPFRAGRVDFSLPNILNWLTKVNPTFECKYVQKGARIVQKMSKKVQEKSLLE